MNQRFDNIKDTIVRNVKRAFYRNRMKSFRSMISLMLVGAIACSLFYTLRHCYIEYAVSRAKISLTYPEIASSQYPDGSRFTYYDFIRPERLDAALKIMQSKGKYENFTVDDIKNNFYVYSYLTGTTVQTVSEVRSGGNDFSYVANEYKITFVQPHDYKNKNLYKKIFYPDYSDEFLEALMEVNSSYFNQAYGGSGGFQGMIDLEDNSKYDYSEKVDMYRTRINAAVNYLNALNEKADGFISEEYNRTLQDLVSEYKILNSNKLDGISSFIDSSGLSADPETTINKTNIILENHWIRFEKYDDAYLINKYAQEAYDHTFTENLIVVTYDDTDGLYQARPKTAFDTVVTQKHTAKENAVEHLEKINELNGEVAQFGALSGNPEEYSRLCEKCDALLADFDQEYQELGNRAVQIVNQFYDATNKKFMLSKVEKKDIVTKEFLMKIFIAFCIGAMLMFILYICHEYIRNARKQRVSSRLRRKLQSEERLRKRGDE